MAAKRYTHGMHAAARDAAKEAKPEAHVRHHGRDMEASRERIARPSVCMPRKLQDWR